MQSGRHTLRHFILRQKQHYPGHPEVHSALEPASRTPGNSDGPTLNCKLFAFIDLRVQIPV
jgi:hypothetical protein